MNKCRFVCKVIMSQFELTSDDTSVRCGNILNVIHCTVMCRCGLFAHGNALVSVEFVCWSSTFEQVE